MRASQLRDMSNRSTARRSHAARHVLVAMRRSVGCVSLVLCACGGRASDHTTESLGVAAKDAGIYFRAVAVSDTNGTSVITFTDPSLPESFHLASSDGTEIPNPRWSPDGRRLAYGARIGEGRFSWRIAKAPDWAVESASLLESAGNVVWWIGMRLVIVDADGWWLFREDGQLLESGPVTSDYERVTTAHGALIVPVPTGYVWLHHSKEPRWIDLEGPADFIPIDDGDRLLVGVALPDRAERISTADIWAIDEEYASDCVPSFEHDCLLRPYQMALVPGTDWVVFEAGTRGSDMFWSALVALPWGTPLTLSLEAGAPGVLKTYGPSGWPTLDVFVGQTMWRVPIEREAMGLPLERIDFSLGPGNAEIATPGILEAGSAYSTTTAQDTVVLTQRLEGDNPITGIWNKLDLGASLPQWEEMAMRGEYGARVGPEGFLSVRAASATPLNLTLKCAPCAYSALLKVLDPDGSSLGGKLEIGRAVSLFEMSNLIKSAPDGSGILVSDNGTLFYHAFDAPGVRFPLVELSEDASFFPPLTWGDP